jgi:outer membrane protein assembly factor BamB
LWKFPAQGKIDSSPFIKDGIVYFSSQDRNLYAVSESDGRLLWKYPLDSLSWNFLLSGNILIVPCFSGNLYAISTDRRLLWKFRGQGYMFPIPAVKDGIVYQACNDDNLYAIDLHTGRLVWKFRGSDSFDTRPFLHGELVIAGNRDNNMYALERRTGRLVWRFRTDSILGWRFIVKDNVAYFGSWDNHLYAVNADNGRLIWKFKTNGPIDGGPEIAGDRVLFGSFDCNLYCLDLQGRLLWKFPTSMGTPSRIEFVSPKEEEITVQTIWRETEEEKKDRKEGIEIRDYANRESEYSSGMSKNYVKGKKGYI